MPQYKVRGPNPDGDYFIVIDEAGEEIALDETYRSEDAELEFIASMEQVT